MANVFFLNKNQQVVANYDTSELLSCVQTEEITTNASELLNDTLSLSMFYNELIKDIRYIVLKDKKTKMYQVLKTSDEDNIIYFECVNFAVTELENFIVKDIRPKNKGIKQVLEQLLDDSDCTWLIGDCSLSLNVTSNFYYVSIKEALKSLQEKGCEFTFDIEITGNKITKKFINCYSKIGVNSHRRFEYGEDVLKIVHEQDRTNIVTAIIGRGKGEEVGDGYGRRIEFSDIEWKKSNGKPLDKPKGQNFLEFPEMTQEYGIPDNDRMLPRKQVVIFDDIEEPNELLQKTYETLLYYCRPLVQFSTEILGSDAIGNIVSIHRGDRNYHYETRVFKVVTDFINGKVESSLGDNLTSTSNAARQISKVQSDLTTLDDKKMTFYQSTEIGKYQDDIMRGAGKNGGSIYLVNGIEAGVSNSRETYEQVFMDAPKIELSEHFMIQNSEGISFKQCQKGEWKTIQDVHNGASNTAWTLDGTFVADFITAGILSGILVQGVALKTLDDKSFQVVVEGGRVSFEKKVISTGLDDVHGESLGSIVSTYGADKNINGFAVWKNPNYIFSINAGDGDGNSIAVFQMPKESTLDNPLYRLIGEGTFRNGKVTFEDDVVFNENVEFKKNVKIAGRLDSGSVYIGGEKVYPGQGSSGGGGDAGGDLSIFVRVLALTAKYEMGDRSSGYYHPPLNDGAGWNYGKYSFTQAYEMDNFLSWLADNYPATRSALHGAVGTTEFNNSWEAYGNANDELFTGLQAEYFCRKKLKPMIDYLKSNTSVDFNDGSKWLGTLSLLSSITNWYPAAVQGGFFYSFVQQYSNNWNDGAFITAVCDYIVANAESMVPAEYAQGIRNRFTNEKQDALQLTSATKIPFDAASSGWQMPIAKPVTVTSEFGWRTSPITGAQELHNGIDLVNGNSTTPIYAAQAGEVIVSTFENSYGNYVVILHADGIYTGYAHMSERIVSVGDTVNRGQQIGNMGSTGDSTGAHLHFQFFRNGPWPQDWPNDFINPRDMMQF